MVASIECLLSIYSPGERPMKVRVHILPRFTHPLKVTTKCQENERTMYFHRFESHNTKICIFAFRQLTPSFIQFLNLLPKLVHPAFLNSILSIFLELPFQLIYDIGLSLLLSFIEFLDLWCLLLRQLKVLVVGIDNYSI